MNHTTANKRETAKNPVVSNIIKVAVTAAIFTGIKLIPVPQGLTNEAMTFLAVFIASIFALTANLTKSYVVMLIALFACAVLKAADFKTVFSAFSMPTLWMIGAAYGIGAAAAKCGLIKRLAYTLIKPFPKTFRGQVIALMLIGTVVSPLIPSCSGKAILLVPIAMVISRELGFEKGSRGAAAMFCAIFIPASVTSVAFLSGNVLSFVALGLMPEEFGKAFTWMGWMESTWVWLAVVTALTVFMLTVVFAPKKAPVFDAEFVNKRLEEMGPVTKAEKRAGIILALTLLLWMTESLHGINSALVAVGALCVYHLTSVIDTKTFRTEVSWEDIILNGGIISMANMFTDVGIADWLGAALAPHVQPLAANRWLFIPAMCVIVYLARYVIISQIACVTVFYMIFGSAAIAAGINPWIVAFVTMTAAQTFNVRFQHAAFVAAEGVMKEDFVEHRDVAKMSYAYMFINLIGLGASVVLWHLQGMI